MCRRVDTPARVLSLKDMLPKDINIPLPKGIKIEGPWLFLTLEERAMTDHILDTGTDDGCLICDPGASDEIIIERHTQIALLKVAVNEPMTGRFDDS